MVIQSSLNFPHSQVQITSIESDFWIDLHNTTLHDAVQKIMVDSQANIPFIIWLFENPSSPIALPGSIDLYGHDCLHILLDRVELSLAEEAFVIGFTMGNDQRTSWFHKLLFKVISSTLYPRKYRFSWKDFRSFDAGFLYGRSLPFQNLNQIDFRAYQHQTVTQVRQRFGISKAKQLIFG